MSCPELSYLPYTASGLWLCGLRQVLQTPVAEFPYPEQEDNKKWYFKEKDSNINASAQDLVHE